MQVTNSAIGTLQTLKGLVCCIIMMGVQLPAPMLSRIYLHFWYARLKKKAQTIFEHFVAKWWKMSNIIEIPLEIHKIPYAVCTFMIMESKFIELERI